MLKPGMIASWRTESRNHQALATRAVFALACMGMFYFPSWQLLQPASRLPSENTVSIPLTTTASSSPYDPTKLAFLVETRPLPHLPFLFIHMTSLMPPEWTFKFMGSPGPTGSIEHLRSSPAIRHLESISKLEILPLPSNYSLSNRETISQMFTDCHLYNTILAPAEHLLVFQPDSIFCANSPRTINDFLEWDWIGAPWSTTAQYGGNGGLSLRRVSKILHVLSTQTRQYNDGALEDLWLTDRLKDLEGAHMPNATISKSFSVESVWDKQPLGYHVGWLGVHHEQIWDEDGQVEHIMKYCPEVKMILGMKLDRDKPGGVD